MRPVPPPQPKIALRRGKSRKIDWSENLEKRIGHRLKAWRRANRRADKAALVEGFVTAETDIEGDLTAKAVIG